jgi:Zn-dependent peptidase ImmA (M78 family)
MTTSSLESMETIRKHQKSAPVEVVPIAQALGLSVYRVTSWPDATSGMIARDAERGGACGFAIYVNAKHSEVRRRFTIAHEVAHFVLHRDLIGDGITEDALYRSGLSDAVEREANGLAAEILMPKHLVRDAVMGGMRGLPELATKFNVSQQAMEFRLINLGLLELAA